MTTPPAVSFTRQEHVALSGYILHTGAGFPAVIMRFDSTKWFVTSSSLTVGDERRNCAAEMKHR